ncbi:helix-turn-helix transcriptional regulator [Thiotrichales bacterium 19S9-12]|nr:helix-turn-helix transcriptional regulator [Thiotrichales bacterium 19S9-11]MCF6812204.1 helix-turn-helix transcriptional regulator [Thiotrichales bacterium 19S9-12]
MKVHITSTKEVGDIIRKARKFQKLTQADLSGISNVGIRFISDIENGKQTAEIGKVIHLLGAVGIAIDLRCDWM